MQRSARSDGSDAVLPQWFRRMVGYCAGLLIVAATVWLIGQALAAVSLILYSLLSALLLTALLMPVVTWTTDRGAPRWLAALATELALVTGIVGGLVLIIRRALNQLNNLTGALDQALSDLQELLVSPPLSLPRDQVDEVRRNLVGFVQDLAPSAGSWATMTLEGLAGLAIVLFVLFFLLKEGPAIAAWALQWSPAAHRELIAGLGGSAWATLTGYVRGMVLVALADAVAIGLALFIIGVPLALSLTVIVFLGAFVPIVGATISGALAVAVTAATIGMWQALIVLGVVLVVQQIEGNLLQPLVMGHAVDLHPVVILTAVTTGALIAGVGGAVVAVPLTAVAYRIAERLIGPSSDLGQRQRA